VAGLSRGRRRGGKGGREEGETRRPDPGHHCPHTRCERGGNRVVDDGGRAGVLGAGATFAGCRVGEGVVGQAYVEGVAI